VAVEKTEVGMRRRDFLGVVSGASVAWPLAARAQNAKMPVIGLLTLANLPDWAMNAIRTGLGEAGFVEGEVNGLMTYDRQRVKMDLDRIAAAARALYDAPPKVISGTQTEKRQFPSRPAN